MKYKFVILSNQPFDLELKTNKWHVANLLAQKGHDVVFVDPPLRFRALKEFLKAPSLDIGKLFCRMDEKRTNLYVYKPANLFNFKPFSLFNTSLHSRKINNMLEKFDCDKVVMWVYHFDFPELREFLTKVPHELLIYDVVDEYTAFPEYAKGKKVNPGLIEIIQKFDDKLKIIFNQEGKTGPEWVLYIERWLSDNADLLFASAPGLVNKFKKWRAQVAYLPNAAAVDKFDKPKTQFKEPEDIKTIPHPRIGFSGAIDTYKNNIPLIEKSARAYPEYHFIMIGPEKVSDPDLDLSSLKKMNNVHFLGLKPWEQTPAYFAYFDCYFIPYNLNDYTVGGCFPVKYFEALAAGLPTVVTNMPAYQGFDIDGYVSKNDEEFIKNLKKAIKENSPEKSKRRKDLAAQNSWEGKVDKQLKLISDALAEKQ